MIAAHQIVQHLLEDEEAEEGSWKEVTPSIAAAGIERWCFTDMELKTPGECAGTDEFLADGDTEMAVIVQRDGTVTNRWEDGTVGVPDDVKQRADFDESPIKPVWRRGQIGLHDADYYADNWRDVYVDKDGHFMAFVEPLKAGFRQTESIEDAGG